MRKTTLQFRSLTNLRPLSHVALCVLLSSCSSMSSLIPFVGDAEEQEQVVLTEPETEASKYGFQTEDKTVEEEILIRRFNVDKDNLDHAIKNTKDLIAKSYGRPFLPELYIRLAELYAEKSRSVFFLRRLEMGERGKTSEVSSVEATGLKEKAIETYMQIISHFPEFDDLDRVHFYLAHELRELGKYESMVEQYQILLKNYPQSAFLPESLLLLGDYSFENKEIDEALAYYRQVLNYPKSSAVVIARYKLAWVHINKRNYKQALTLFEQSVTNTDAPSTVDVDTYNRVDIRLEALADMAFSYSHVYPDTKPGEDSEYFKKYAWSRQSYMLVMEKLANRYMIKFKWDNAAHIYRELAQIQFNSDKLLEYTENLFTCVSESKNYNNAEGDVALIVRALEKNRYSAHMQLEEKQKLVDEYEIYARDIATRLHEKAKRSETKEDFAITADSYEEYLNFFDESEHYAQIQENYAESLFSAGDFTRAGRIYETIATSINDPKRKHDPLYSAAVSYYTALDDRDTLNYYEIAYSQDGLRDVGQSYVSLYPSSSKVQDIIFNIARVRYDEGDFDSAVEEFIAFVNKYPKGKNAQAAVQLMMDALHLTENYQGLVELQQSLAKIPQLDPAVKSEMAAISKSAQAKIVQEMVVDSINDWESGKEKLLDFAENTKTAGMDIQALNALFVSSSEHGDIETMHVAGQSIVARFPKSEHANKALKELIRLSLSTAQFRALADYLEQYQTQFPKSSNSREFIQQAAEIRTSLNQNQLAIKNYNLLLGRYKLDKEEKGRTALAISKLQIKSGDNAAALKTLEKNKSSINSASFNALGAKLALDQRQLSAGERYFKKARQLHSSGRVAPAYIDPLSEASYTLAMLSYERYMNMRMGSSIDNKMMESKTALHERLQKELLRTTKFKSPRWSILACFRLHEINTEYARFLETAPMPEGFSAEDISEYKQIIQQTALEYKNEALQYLHTGEDLASKVRPFDRKVSTYDSRTANASGKNISFVQGPKYKHIGLEGLKDPELRTIYDALYKNPSDADTLLALAKAYQFRGDKGQAMVVAQNLLGGNFKLGSRRRSQAYAIMGSVYIDYGEDKLARDVLRKSLDLDKSAYSSSVNLAGLYWHYGYADYANGVYSERVGLKTDDARLLIHARAEGFFNGQ
ncbi:Uncharacterized protein conserved in bacteria [Alteromonadaceae bacterium Bs31]|nr:Uncharacterized protein conserved in bacteria [Alteromonadaceae bacterium Bs31]